MKDDEILQDYLLGHLDAEQAGALEQRLLRDEELFELAEAVEADLLDAAVRGARSLSPADRGRLLRRTTQSSGGRERLHISRGLIAISRQPSSAEVLAFRLLKKPWVRAAAIAASLLVVPAGLWLGLQTLKPGGAVACIDCALPASAVLQLALTTVRSETGALSPLAIPAGTRNVEIRLTLGPDDPSTPFGAVLRNAETGEEILREPWIEAQNVDGGRALVLSVPAEELAPGTYEVEVRRPTEGDALFGKPIFEVASTNPSSRRSGDAIP